MPTILITGASRGIGFTIAQSYLLDGWRVLGTQRSKSSCLPEGVEPILLDVADPSSILSLKDQLAGIPIDVLWNNAGIYVDKNIPSSQVSDDDWLRSFTVNSLAPLKIAQILLPNVLISERKVMAFTSSIMGSLGANGCGSYAYRSSKAALNMVVRCFANDHQQQGVSCLLLHPGHVRTDMGGEQGAIDVATSVAGMRQVVDRVSPATQKKYSSQFFNYDGSVIPW